MQVKKSALIYTNANIEKSGLFSYFIFITVFILPSLFMKCFFNFPLVSAGFLLCYSYYCKSYAINAEK